MAVLNNLCLGMLGCHLPIQLRASHHRLLGGGLPTGGGAHTWALLVFLPQMWATPAGLCAV
jgi:hypothetical protein